MCVQQIRWLYFEKKKNFIAPYLKASSLTKMYGLFVKDRTDFLVADEETR